MQPMAWVVMVERDVSGKGRTAEVIDISSTVGRVLDRAWLEVLVRATIGKEIPSTTDGWNQLLQDAMREAMEGGA